MQDYSVILNLGSITSKSFRAISNVLLSFPQRRESIIHYYRITPWSCIWSLSQVNPFALLATCICHSREGGNPLLPFAGLLRDPVLGSITSKSNRAFSNVLLSLPRRRESITTFCRITQWSCIGLYSSKSFRAISNVLLSFPRRRESITTFCRITQWSWIWALSQVNPFALSARCIFYLKK